ncbi:MAG TPA: hypothetical protein VGF94_19190 [Kofleriaceae bacterium]|jgi:hypothetical protein
MRTLLVVVALGCGASSPPPPEPVHEAARVSVDAAVAPAPPDATAPIPVPSVPPEPPPPAAFVPPAPLASPGPPPPSSSRCRDTIDNDLVREDAREVAAIDRALRARGFIPLDIAIRGGVVEAMQPPAPAGRSVHATRAGNHFELAVDEINGCGGKAPSVAMTTAHEVFVVTPRLVPRARRTVLECTNSCRGACGIARPASIVRAIVPPDAVLVDPRDLNVPLDVKVDFHYAKRMNCNVP